jgi:hypothetical protein
MIASLRHFLGWLVCAFRSREDLVLESRALHQQSLALHAQRQDLRAIRGPTRSISERCDLSGRSLPRVSSDNRTVTSDEGNLIYDVSLQQGLIRFDRYSTKTTQFLMADWLTSR